jgi:hypothetical protein
MGAFKGLILALIPAAVVWVFIVYGLKHII